MSTLLWGDFDGVPLDEAKVRATTAPVERDAPPAEAQGAPEFNEVETDSNPNLGGLSTRQLASDWHEPEKYPPSWAGTATAEHNAIVDRQVASAGSAAERELAGQYGHGTTGWAYGIEPTIREGGAFGNEYFAANERDIQDEPSVTAESRGVQPALGMDRESIAGIGAYGNSAARDASNNMADLYARIVGS